MKKLTTIAFLLSALGSTAMASDCIMAKELNVHFKNDSVQFMDARKENAKINEFASFAKQTDLYVLIEGHTNKLSSAPYNYSLSTRRAIRVMNSLVNRGVKKSHIRAMGFGESTPLYSNETQYGLEHNRRVIAEVFGSAEELNSYIQESKQRIKNIKFKEQ